MYVYMYMYVCTHMCIFTHFFILVNTKAHIYMYVRVSLLNQRKTARSLSGTISKSLAYSCALG